MSNDKKTIYLFFGEDNFSVNEKINHWRKEFEKKHGDINIEILEGKKLTNNELKNSIETSPFLGEKRLVIIHDFLDKGNKDEQKKVAEILEKMPDTCILAFIENGKPDQRTSLFKKINKLGQTSEFKFLTDAELVQWILKKAQNIQIAIQSKEALYLSSLTGPNLWNLENELGKLRMYCQKRQVEKEDIDKLVKPSLTSSIFKLTDYLSQKARIKSLKTLDILRESGEEEIKILFMIGRHFRILIQVQDLLEKGFQKHEIIGKIKEHPYVIQIAMTQCKNFKTEKLKEILKNIHLLDVGIKTGKIRTYADDKREINLAIEKFIVELCNP